MIYDNLNFHNVAELVKVDRLPGLRLQRVPETVRAQLDAGTAGVMLSPANCEIQAAAIINPKKHPTQEGTL